jgi:Ca2+-binding EF-hand superfamily protein
MHATMVDGHDNADGVGCQAVLDAHIVKRVADSALAKPDQLRRAFRRLDADNDGKVSYAEFKRGMCDMKARSPPLWFVVLRAADCGVSHRWICPRRSCSGC